MLKTNELEKLLEKYVGFVQGNRLHSDSALKSIDLSN